MLFSTCVGVFHSFVNSLSALKTVHPDQLSELYLKNLSYIC